ncbi:PorV/PorQ family protein [Rubrivirga sp. IMCC45206]|uniref:PorV/PorQ family protein n=1 Tax=Rubrivirga sp. IMCC45206 TaxID=3391614 RepID=UPI00398FEB2B
MTAPRSLLRLAAAALVVAAGPAHAQKVGTTSFQFLKVMPTARATAMGDAYAGLAQGAEALFWNPAGLAYTTGHAVSATYIPYLVDTQITSAGYATSLGGFGQVGVQFQAVDYGSIAETRTDRLGFNTDGTYNPGLTGGSYSPTAFAAGLSYARRLTDRFATGITAKYVHESLYDGDYSGAGGTFNTGAGAVLFDFGIQYQTGFRSLDIAMSVQNFGPEVAFVEERFAAPLTFRLGATGDLVGPQGIVRQDPRNRLTVAYDLHQPNDYDQQMQVGMEYSFAEVLALRGGYKVNYDAEGLTLGAGINADLRAARLNVDYSYGTMGEFLGSVHRITVGATLR